jgi:c-di-GMP-related signal transduction protein
MRAFAAAHPIFNRQLKVYGYDLEFRSGFEAHCNQVISEDVVADLWKAMHFEEIVGLARAHVVFPRDLLVQEFPVLFPADTLIVGVPQNGHEDWDLLNACRRLKEVGYELALVDFGPEHLDSPFLEFVDIAWIDAGRTGPDEQKDVCEALPARGVRTLATNVNSAEAFNDAAGMGYWHFQGDFFRQPVLQADKEIATTKLHYLQLLNEVNKPELAYDDLEALIKQDVSMTYRLLRFINSAWFGLRKTVESIRHALVLLGPAEVRVWASMLVLKDLGEDKPDELFRRCLIRAKMGESIAPLVGLRTRASELFLMGMFSLVDALTDIPLARVLEGLPVSRSIKMALLGQLGEFGPVHKAVVAYERGRWDEFSAAAEAFGLDEAVMPDVFAASRKWADDALGAI